MKKLFYVLACSIMISLTTTSCQTVKEYQKGKINDADMQGLGIIRGKGFEMVITLGTGLGSSLFLNGHLLPHLELSQHPEAMKSML